MNTTVWLISFTGSDGVKVQKVHTHNCVADYRLIDPAATVQAIDCAAVAELIEAAVNVYAAVRAGKEPDLIELADCIDAMGGKTARKNALARVGGAK